MRKREWLSAPVSSDKQNCILFNVEFEDAEGDKYYAVVINMVLFTALTGTKTMRL